MPDVRYNDLQPTKLGTQQNFLAPFKFSKVTTIRSNLIVKRSKPPPMKSLALLLIFTLFSLHIIVSNATPSFPKEALPTKTGYLRVISSSNSSLFYAFYEAQKPTSPLPQTPLIIWLQGGPGCSSMIGNFFELGPWRVSPSPNKGQIPILKPNPGAWNHLFGLLFIDNPIGTGFSIASTPGELPRDQVTVAKHLFIAIRKFITLNPSFKSRPIYITGESYAGKYVPAIGYYILRQNAQLSVSQQVKLGGIAIGNGLTDPITQVATHAVTSYYSGLINEKQSIQIDKLQRNAIELTRQGNWSNAAAARGAALDALQTMSGLATLYDLRRKKGYNTGLVDQFLANQEIKEAFGFPKSIVWEECNAAAGNALQEDLMKSVKFMVEELVKRTKVLLYQGQFDLRDGVVTTEAWVKTLKWGGIKNFLDAERKVWEVNGEFAGYVQRWGMLSEVVVAGAGHMVPADQAVNSQAMIQDWVLGRGMFDLKKM